jgi:pullulanase/glycogen debranching enzyme
MTEEDWRDPGASVLGMWLRRAGDAVLVWFNRRVVTVTAQLPKGRAPWAIGLVSDDTAEVEIAEDGGSVALPPRSVVALAAEST